MLGQRLVKGIVLQNRKVIFLHKSFFSLVCFKVFDVDRDGVLSRVELRDMVVALLEVWKDNRTDDIPVSSDCIHIVVCKLPIGKWSGEFKKREKRICYYFELLY